MSFATGVLVAGDVNADGVGCVFGEFDVGAFEIYLVGFYGFDFIAVEDDAGFVFF